MSVRLEWFGAGQAERDPYGLVSQEIFTSPHLIYRLLQHAAPVHWSEVLNAWVLTRYEDVLAALKDVRLSNALRRGVGSAQLAPEVRTQMAPIDKFLSMWVLNLDGAEHHQLRILLSKAFTPRQAEALRPHIEQIATELLDAVQHQHSMDFVTQFAQPLPVRVIAEMFGIPEHDRPLLARWSKDISTFFAFGPARAEVLTNMARSLQEMGDYLRGVIKESRGHPKTNLLGSLILAEEQGEMLTEDQVIATCVMLLFAGHDSTVNLIGNGMLALLQHPGERMRLRADPSLIKTAVQEFLRYESPVMRHDRVAREDFDLHGHCIRAGQRVVLVLGAANRDPTRFSNPDTLDVGRKENRHTTFGHGPHACLGAALATIQAEIAINLVLERLPGLRLARQPYRWRQHFNFRGLETLPVEF